MTDNKNKEETSNDDAAEETANNDVAEETDNNDVAEETANDDTEVETADGDYYDALPYESEVEQDIDLGDSVVFTSGSGKSFGEYDFNFGKEDKTKSEEDEVVEEIKALNQINDKHILCTFTRKKNKEPDVVFLFHQEIIDNNKIRLTLDKRNTTKSDYHNFGLLMIKLAQEKNQTINLTDTNDQLKNIIKEMVKKSKGVVKIIDESDVDVGRPNLKRKPSIKNTPSQSAPTN